MMLAKIVVAISLAFLSEEALANKVYRATAPENFIGKVVGDGHAIKFVQAATGAPNTSKWLPGPWVRGNKSILPGTAIATFEADGTFTPKRGNHAAIYISQDAFGIWVYDQWREQPVHKRLIRFEGGRGPGLKYRSNDGILYRVIKGGDYLREYLEEDDG
jgi:hypothetical protein